MSLRTYLEAAWKDGKAPIDPSTLVIIYKFYFHPDMFSILKFNLTFSFSLTSDLIDIRLSTEMKS